VTSVVRAARAEGVEAVLRAASLFDSPPNPDALRRYLADDRNLLLLAYEEGEAAGFLRGTALGQVATPRPQMFLYEIDVAPAFRRHGVARTLIEWLLAYCRDGGFEEVFVLTEATNTAAIRLYESTGGRPESPGERMFVYKFDESGRREPGEPNGS
jgi:ribosomal protein S18 acetylase RimI-like enzyme